MSLEYMCLLDRASMSLTPPLDASWVVTNGRGDVLDYDGYIEWEGETMQRRYKPKGKR